jgi:PIN domain nuclease of toxin-antitoxin system
VTRLLLDTSAVLLLSFDFDPNAISRRHRDHIEGGKRLISHVSAIEVAIKHGVGKLLLPPSFDLGFETGFANVVDQLAADMLTVNMAHIDRMSRLPLHHRDPFDRLLIAQALVENLTIVTRDRSFALYPGLNVYEN